MTLLILSGIGLFMCGMTFGVVLADMLWVEPLRKKMDSLYGSFGNFIEGVNLTIR